MNIKIDTDTRLGNRLGLELVNRHKHGQTQIQTPQDTDMHIEIQRFRCWISLSLKHLNPDQTLPLHSNIEGSEIRLRNDIVHHRQ
jgi:hypothetical protein